MAERMVYHSPLRDRTHYPVGRVRPVRLLDMLPAVNDAASSAALRFEGIRRRFGRLSVLEGVSGAVAPGEVLLVTGPNGSGKSTLLRLVGGLLLPDAGSIELDGRPVSEADPRVGLVFQEPRLLPWRRSVDNVAFPLELAGVPVAERRRRAAELLDLVGLAGFPDAYPHQLSGGMRQRVALARALARDPSVLLLDEPFSALDAFTRLALQEHLLDLWSYDRPTFVLVTHDIDEALALADRIVLMRGHPGRIHREFAVDLPRPRSRTSPRFLAWKEEVLRELHITAASGRSAISVSPLRAAM